MRSNRAKSEPRRQTLIGNPFRDTVKGIQRVRPNSTMTTTVRRSLTTQDTANSSRLAGDLPTWPIHPSVVDEVHFLPLVAVMPAPLELSS